MIDSRTSEKKVYFFASQEFTDDIRPTAVTRTNLPTELERARRLLADASDHATAALSADHRSADRRAVPGQRDSGGEQQPGLRREFSCMNRWASGCSTCCRCRTACSTRQAGQQFTLERRAGPDAAAHAEELRRADRHACSGRTPRFSIRGAVRPRRQHRRSTASRRASARSTTTSRATWSPAR